MRNSWDKSKYLLNERPALSIVLGTLLLALCITAFPTYRFIKKHRSNSVLAESKELFENKDYSQSFQKAHTASLLNPQNVDAARHLARLALDFGHPKAYQFWERVLTLDSTTASDWRSATQASIINGSPEKTFEYLEKWKRLQPENVLEHTITRVQTLLYNDRFFDAKDELSEAIILFPENAELHRMYFSVVNEFGDPNDKRRVRKKLAEWKNRKDELGIKTLRSIVVAQSYSDLERKEAANLLQHHPLSSSADNLRAIAALAMIDTDYLNEMDDAISKIVDLKDLESLRTYTAILIESGRYSEVLEILDADKATTDKRLYQNFLIAKIGVGSANEVLDRTSEQNVELSSLAEEAILRALAFKESGNKANYKFNIEESINKATDEDITFIQHQLLKLGEKDLLLKLYQKLSSHPKFGKRSQQLALQVAIDLKDEKQLLNLLKSNDLKIDDVSISQKPIWIYLSFIYGENIEVARKQIQSLATSNLRQPLIQTLLAYSNFIDGNLKTAQSLAINNPNDTNLRNILLNLVIFTGTPEEAKLREQLNSLDTSSLLSAELKLAAL